MSEEYRFKDRIKDIINGDVDYDKLRKAEKQGWIDRDRKSTRLNSSH